jgi:hypothetical protein
MLSGVGKTWSPCCSKQEALLGTSDICATSYICATCLKHHGTQAACPYACVCRDPDSPAWPVYATSCFTLWSMVSVAAASWLCLPLALLVAAATVSLVFPSFPFQGAPCASCQAQALWASFAWFGWRCHRKVCTGAGGLSPASRDDLVRATLGWLQPFGVGPQRTLTVLSACALFSFFLFSVHTLLLAAATLATVGGIFRGYPQSYAGGYPQ